MYMPACSPVVAKYIAASIKSGPLGYINRHRQQGPNMWCVVWYSFILSFGAICISSEAGLWLQCSKLPCQGLISKVILPMPGHELVEMADVVFAELDIWLGGISWESKKLVSH